MGAFLLILAGQLTLLAKEDAPAPPAVGARVRDFTLQDIDGQARSLGDYRNKNAVAIVFVGNDCPLANLYIPTLAEMHQKYSAKGIQFLAINSNDQDAFAEVSAHARDRKVPFPVLKDSDHRAAVALGASRTPEAFLLDSERTIRYSGRIDDQYGYTYRRASPTHTELKDAIEQLLARRPVIVSHTEVQGCVIGGIKKESPNNSKR
jgi:peroxiredoxin